MPLNLQELIEFYKTEKKRGNPVPVNGELVWASLTRVAKENNPRLIQKYFRILRGNSFINFLTSVTWKTSKEGVIYHNKNTFDEYSRNFIEESGQITIVRPNVFLREVFGTGNVRDLNLVSKIINKTFIGLDATVSNFRLYALADPQSECSAFRARWIPEK